MIKIKHIFLLLAFSFSIVSFSQTPTSEWILSFGVNTVNNLGTRSPVKNIDDWAFKNPAALNVEKRLNNRFALDFGLSMNGYDVNDAVDGGPSDANYDYFSFDPSVKYYFGDLIFAENSRFHLYALAGPGFFFVDESNVTANVGGGLLVWLNANRSFGLKLQTFGKFAIDNKDERIENNHFQSHLQLVISL